MKKKDFDFSKFEALSHAGNGQLANGFSVAMEAPAFFGGTGDNKNAVGCTNNCAGGNCVAGCGGHA